jgi:hypothetical protein
MRSVLLFLLLLYCPAPSLRQQTAAATEDNGRDNPCAKKLEFGTSAQVRMPAYWLSISPSSNTAPNLPFQYTLTMAGSEGTGPNVTVGNGLLSAADRQTLQTLLAGHITNFQFKPEDRFAILRRQPILYTKDAVDEEISKARKEMICALQEEVTKAAISDAVVKPVDDRIKALEEQVQKLSAEVASLKAKIK